MYLGFSINRIQLAVADAVEEVDSQADRQPDDEADPGVEGQGDHLGETNQSSGNWNPR